VLFALQTLAQAAANDRNPPFVPNAEEGSGILKQSKAAI